MKNPFNPKSTPLGEQVAIQIAKNARKGEFHTVYYMKKMVFGDIVVTKISAIQGRFGVDYDNLKETIEDRENGKEKGVLKGFKTLIQDLLYETIKTGRKAIRFTSYKGSLHETQWFENDEPTTLEALLEKKLPKSKLVHSSSDKDAIPMFVMADGVLAVI